MPFGSHPVQIWPDPLPFGTTHSSSDQIINCGLHQLLRTIPEDARPSCLESPTGLFSRQLRPWFVYLKHRQDCVACWSQASISRQRVSFKRNGSNALDLGQLSPDHLLAFSDKIIFSSFSVWFGLVFGRVGGGSRSRWLKTKRIWIGEFWDTILRKIKSLSRCGRNHLILVRSTSDLCNCFIQFLFHFIS